MPDSFGEGRMGELLGQLCAAFGKPFASNAAKMTTAYHRALSDWPIEAVEWAVWNASRELDKFPRPATLRALCAKSPHKKAPAREGLGTAYDAWATDPWSEVPPYDSKPCPVCGSGYEWTRRGLLIVHSRELHREAGVAYSDAGKPEWRDLPALPIPPARKPKRDAEVHRHLPAEQTTAAVVVHEKPEGPHPLAALIEPVAAAAHAIIAPADAGEAWEAP